MAADAWTDTTLQEIGARVRAARRARQLNQDDFADLAGVHRAYVGMIENGKKDVRISTLYRLAAALDMPVTRLLSDDDVG